MADGQLTGICLVRFDGKTLRSEDGATIDPGGKSRPSKVFGNFVGYTESTKQSSVEATCAHTADTDLIALGKIKNATVEFECDTGQIFVINGARVVEPPALTGGGSGFKIKFEGPPADNG